MAWIPAVAVGAGTLLGSVFSSSNAKEASREQVEFQRDMSNTAYQRTVNDMRKAGINPMLAAKLGGASTPAGAQPQQFFDPGKVASSAMEAKRTTEEVKTLQATQQREKSNANAADAQAAYTDALSRSQAYENAIKETMFKTGTYAAQIDQQYAEARAGTTAAQLERQLDTEGGEFFRMLRRLGVTGGSASSMLGGIGSVMRNSPGGRSPAVPRSIPRR